MEGVQLVFFGSPLWEVVADCSTDFLQKYSLKPDDCVRATQHNEGLFEELFRSPESRLGAGGSALNSAKIAKWTLGQKGDVAFAGCVGDDDYALALTNDLQSKGVKPLFVTSKDMPTGTCACLLSSGGRHRSMCTRQGAAASFSKVHLESPEIKERLQAADCIFVVGYLLAYSPEVVYELATHCKPQQWFVLSLAAEYVCREFKDAILDILPKVDVLFGNESEINSFNRFRERNQQVAAEFENCSTIEDAATSIAKFKKTHDRPRLVVVTRGPRSVIVVKGDEAACHYPVTGLKAVKDTVGCGDALAGAFIATYLLSSDVDEAVKAGIVAAVEIAQVSGCDPPNRDLEDLLTVHEIENFTVD